MTGQKPSWFSLSPLLVFLSFYLVTSILVNDFYKVPITVSFIVSSVYAVCITRGLSLSQRIVRFSQGAADSNMMLMIWIFILAGAFAQSAKAMGAVDATVNLTLQLLPESLLLPGLFLASCFISLSIGTSVGTVVALTPMAVGIADQTGALLPMVVGIVVGGAYFGDNLSFISDTTIVATQTQGCRMSDKFRVNVRIVAPAALLVLGWYAFKGMSVEAPATLSQVEWLRVIPYLVVLVTALCGVNVMLVLTIGLLLTGGIGIVLGSYDFFGWLDSMHRGILGMGELIVVTLLAGGMLELIRYNGGIDYIISRLTRHIRGKRGAEFSIASLVMLADVCTANNTIALMTAGPLAKEIADRYGVDNRRSASILDTFSCLAQSIIPYGAQLLMAAGLASISPVSIIPFLYYPFMMGGCAVLSILFRYPRKFS
ncbi:MAG: Na+/H+ antiporter NhaC family protein [Bacteroidaceae bacterium]|nr:Na+/H+ antiporter NhaC family protein [Bacteroidaceae bacterium]